MIQCRFATSVNLTSKEAATLTVEFLTQEFIGNRWVRDGKVYYAARTSHEFEVCEGFANEPHFVTLVNALAVVETLKARYKL